MYVIIAGAGILGRSLARILVEHKHDVVVIDIDDKALERCYVETGAICINGNSSQIETLLEAGIEKADVVCCVMKSDADNLALAILAKSYNVKKIIVRMRDPQYEKAYALSGVDATVSITNLVLNQFLNEVEKPDVQRVLTIGEDKAEIVIMKMPENSICTSKTINEIGRNPEFPSQCIIAGILTTEGNFIIPRGDNVLQAHNIVYLIAKKEVLNKAIKFLTRKK